MRKMFLGREGDQVKKEEALLHSASQARFMTADVAKKTHAKHYTPFFSLPPKRTGGRNAMPPMARTALFPPVLGLRRLIRQSRALGETMAIGKELLCSCLEMSLQSYKGIGAAMMTLSKSLLAAAFAWGWHE